MTAQGGSLLDSPAGSSARIARQGKGPRIFASPLARRLAHEAGLQLSELRGSGPGGRIVRRDVEAGAISGAATRAGHAAASEAIASGVRAASLARREPIETGLIGPSGPEWGLGTAPLLLSGVAQVDRLVALIGRLTEDPRLNVTAIDLIVMAVASAHRNVPAMNVSWDQGAVQALTSVDIAFTVSTPLGTVAPVLHGAERLRLTPLAESLRDLAGRAVSDRLAPFERSGAAITVADYGPYGTREAAAVLRPRHAAGLAVGAITQAPVVKKGRLQVGHLVHLSLAVDPRCVEGPVAAQWLATLVASLENPVTILA